MLFLFFSPSLFSLTLGFPALAFPILFLIILLSHDLEYPVPIFSLLFFFFAALFFPTFVSFALVFSALLSSILVLAAPVFPTPFFLNPISPTPAFSSPRSLRCSTCSSVTLSYSCCVVSVLCGYRLSCCMRPAIQYYTIRPLMGFRSVQWKISMRIWIGIRQRDSPAAAGLLWNSRIVYG